MTKDSAGARAGEGTITTHDQTIHKHPVQALGRGMGILIGGAIAYLLRIEDDEVRERSLSQLTAADKAKHLRR